MDPMNAVQELFPHFYPRPNKKQNKHKQQSWPKGPPQTRTKKHNSRAGPQGRPKQKTKKTRASELAHRAAPNEKKRNTIVITHRGESHTGL